MDSGTTSGTTLAAKFFGFLLFLVLGSITSGLAIAYVWSLFIVPLGVKGISAATGIGIATLARLLVPGQSPITTTNAEPSFDFVTVFKVCLDVFLPPLLSVGIAWIVHQFQ